MKFIKLFFIESIFVLTGILLSLLYILFPNPFLMTVFLFVVQPMILFVIAKIIVWIYRDLKQSEVL